MTRGIQLHVDIFFQYSYIINMNVNIFKYNIPICAYMIHMI